MLKKKHSATKFQARASMHCTQAFVFSNFVTECLLKVCFFYENNWEQIVVHGLMDTINRKS